MVAEAKAFCPACGSAIIEEEKRQEESKFEKLSSTVQFGQTMYNQMLEDMGLNISAPPDRGEKRVEIIAPIPTETAAPVKADAAIKPQVIPAKPERGGNVKWYILGAVMLVVLFPIALASAIFLFLEIWSRVSR